MVEPIWDVADSEENFSLLQLGACRAKMELTYARGKAFLKSRSFPGNFGPCHCTQTMSLLYAIPRQ